MKKKTEELSSLGLQLGTLSLNHSLVCRALIIFSLVIFTTFFIASITNSSNGQGHKVMDFFALKRTFVTRRKMLRKACVKHQPKTDLDFSTEFSYKKSRVKVCSSHFLENNNVTTNPSSARSHTLKLMLVSHPFERILDSYISHFESSKGLEFSNKFLQSFGEEKRAQILSFSEFVAYLIDTRGSVDPDQILSRAFLHQWAPFWKICAPCQNFSEELPNSIVKMDQEGHLLQEELQFVFREAGINEPLQPQMLHEILPHLVKSDTSFDRSQKYYGQLSKSQVLGLQHVYELDLEMFDYSIEPFAAFAQNE